MAHGFLTPESVSGDNFWKNAKDLWNLLQRLKKRKAPPEEVVPAVVSELQKALPPGKQKLLSPGAQKLLSGKNQQALGPAKASNMLSAAPVSKMLGSGKSEITIKQQLALPPGGPKLPPSGGMPGKGGTFTNIPGVSSAPKKLDSEAFFKAAQTGVDPQTGRYLSSEERKDFLKKSKATMNAPASVASAGIASASTSVTKGDEQIVTSVEDLTKIVVNLVDAVKAQTSAQVKAANAQKASTERTANRALAAAEESSLEQSTDLSGTITPSGGIGSTTPGAGGGGGGGLLGAAGSMVAGKAAQAVTKRGLSRALPRIGASVAGKTGARAGAQATAKVGTNVAAKTGAKAAARMIPGVQTALGVGFAMDSFSKGDVLGGLLNLGSAIPGPLGWAFLGGSVANDLSKGGSAEAAPFAQGGIITQPTLSVMGEGRKKEGVFPLEGKEGKKTFEMFGQGMFEAQRKNKREYASIQSAGLKQYYENEDGFKKMGEGLKKFFEGLAGGIASLFGGAANAKEFNPAENYLMDGGIGGSTGERNAAAFLSTLEGGGGQTAADTFQVMLNRTANAKKGGAMKAYGNTLFDQLTAKEQFSPFSAAIYGASADSAAAKKYGPITAALGKTPAERKKKLLEIASGPDGLAALQKLFKAGSATEASKVLADFESNGKMSKSSSEFVGAAMSFRGYETSGSRRRSEGGNYFFGAAKGTKAASLNAVSAAPEGMEGNGVVLSTGRLPALPDTGTAHGQNYGANRRGGRKHAGVDFDIKGNDKFYSRIGGTVTKVGYDPNGYGNYVDIYNDQLKVTERIAEGKTVLVKQGQKVSPGTAVTQGESGTGVIHYEIRKDNGGFGFAGTVNPLNFLASATNQRGDVASKPTAVAAKPRSKADLIGGGGQGGGRGSRSRPESVAAKPVNPPSGVQLAQASTADAVSQRRNTRGGGTTIINNNNVQSGSGAQVASAAPAGGSSSMGLGALAIRLAS